MFITLDGPLKKNNPLSLTQTHKAEILRVKYQNLYVMHGDKGGQFFVQEF